MTLVHVLDRSEAAALVSVPIEAIRALGAPIGASLRWEVRDGRLIIEPARRNCPSFTELMGAGDVPKE